MFAGSEADSPRPKLQEAESRVVLGPAIRCLMDLGLTSEGTAKPVRKWGYAERDC
jgi:hypothetical protein